MHEVTTGGRAHQVHGVHRGLGAASCRTATAAARTGERAPRRRRSASSVGWAKCVPSARPGRCTAAHDGRVRVAGERDAVAAVQVDVLGAVDVVDLRTATVAEPHGLRLGDLPAGRGAAGQGTAGRARPARPTAAAAPGRRSPRGRSARRDGCARCRGRSSGSWPYLILGAVRRCPGRDPAGLTERSVYASVLPTGKARRESRQPGRSGREEASSCLTIRRRDVGRHPSTGAPSSAGWPSPRSPAPACSRLWRPAPSSGWCRCVRVRGKRHHAEDRQPRRHR